MRSRTIVYSRQFYWLTILGFRTSYVKRTKTQYLEVAAQVTVLASQCYRHAARVARRVLRRPNKRRRDSGQRRDRVVTPETASPRTAVTAAACQPRDSSTMWLFACWLRLLLLGLWGTGRVDSRGAKCLSACVVTQSGRARHRESDAVVFSPFRTYSSLCPSLCPIFIRPARCRRRRRRVV